MFEEPVEEQYQKYKLIILTLEYCLRFFQNCVFVLIPFTRGDNVQLYSCEIAFTFL